MTDNEQNHCPVETAIGIFGGKWKPLILWHLFHGVRRFGELQRLIPGITRKVLTDDLRALERDGILARRVYGQVPPKVEYSVTRYGSTLRPVFAALCDWGAKHERRAAKIPTATRTRESSVVSRLAEIPKS